MNILKRLFAKKEESCCTIKIEEVNVEAKHTDEVIREEKDKRASEK